jgi:malic enzyme
LDTEEDLARYYTPGVAEQGGELADDPALARSRTVRANSVVTRADQCWGR